MRQVESRWADSQLIGTRVRSVWQWQLIFTFSTVAIAVIIAILKVSLLTQWPFVAGILIVVAVSATAIVVPWARLPKSAALVLPFIDIVAIGLLALSEERLGYLWVFPITWIATYWAAAQLIAALALIAAVLLVSTWTARYTTEIVLQLLIVIVALTFLGVTMMSGTRRTRAFSHLMRRQSERLDRALHRARFQDERTSALFDGLHVALARVDADGHLLATNDTYRELYSLDLRDDRFPAGAVEYDDYRGAALTPDATSVARAARGERVDGETLWLYDRSGRWHALALSIRPDRLDADDVQARIIELEDRTEAALLTRDRSTSARVVSHELRNPLTAVLGHADLLLEDGDLTPAQREHLAVIESAGERMLTLIQGLLAHDADAAPAASRFDMADVVAAAVAAFRPAADAAEVRLDSRVVGPLPLEGDAFRMRQVVDNLLSNAIKYTERGGVVRLAAHDGDGTVTLDVADTGIGMAADDLARVFDPYFRAQTAEQGGITGTGLGMGITRDIVTAHGGTITLDSTLGKGTTVTVRLPTAEGGPQGGTP